MTSSAIVQFWQPAFGAAAELVCASFETSDGPPHLHEEWQFGVVETPAKLTLGAFRRYGVQADDVTMVPPYDVHSEGSEPGELPKWRMLYVSPTLMNRINGSIAPRFPGPVIADRAAADELRGLLRDSGDGIITGAGFLSRVTVWLERFLAGHAELRIAPRRRAAVERARAYLQDRPTQSVTLSEVGAVAGITISHLVRSFSRVVGLPPRSYHTQLRLAHARRLLAEGKSATWVAYECGFADQSHLNRRFKECHGVTPGVFQAQYLTGLQSAIAAEANAA